MDGPRPDAPLAALHERRSRRAALRLIAGGALGGALTLGGRAAPAEAAVTRLPALPTGWAHLAGTTTSLLFYQRGSGRAHTGTCVDGRYARKGA
jgi:hypothetical protein